MNSTEKFFSLFIMLMLSFSISTRAQLFTPKKYPVGYFQWPVKSVPAIVANFGELRPNHYHMGLDCRTEGKVNLPILAAADGFISKIHIDATGFGRTLYVDHPNGLTTVYAHLNDFYPELETYLEKEQYRLQKWNVDLFPKKDQFKLSKGQFIAYSGNTGGSQGPHLHFEIRDTRTEKVLNPLFFGFQIQDNIAPDIIRLAMYDRRYSTYEQSPKIIALKKSNGVYRPVSGSLLANTDQLSFAITAFDRYSGSTNQNGIFSAVLSMDGKEITGFELDEIGYDETRNHNAHIDYKTRASGGPWLQHISPLPGFQNSIYRTADGSDGIIRLKDLEMHEIEIKVMDVQGNTSTLLLNVQKAENITHRSLQNTGVLFEPGMVNVYEDEKVWIHMPEKVIYDSFHFRCTPTSNNSFIIQGHQIPAIDYYTIRIKTENLPISDTGKLMMKMVHGSKERFRKAHYDRGWAKSSFRDFGALTLIIDTIAPSITPISPIGKSRRIGVSVSDNTKELESFNAFLDGKWILFTNDKGKNFYHNLNPMMESGEHILKVIVTDLTGNKTEKEYHFTR
ncbi:MAG: hypothetical protein RIR96_1233 [Bacteroidota bacterium]